MTTTQTKSLQGTMFSPCVTHIRVYSRPGSCAAEQWLTESEESRDTLAVTRATPACTNLDSNESLGLIPPVAVTRQEHALLVPELLAAILSYSGSATLWKARSVNLLWNEVIEQLTYLGRNAFYRYGRTDIRRFKRTIKMSCTSNLRISIAKLPAIRSSCIINCIDLVSHRITILAIKNITADQVQLVSNLFRNELPRLVELVLRGHKRHPIAHNVPTSMSLTHLINATPFLKRLSVEHIKFRDPSLAHSISRKLNYIKIITHEAPLIRADDLPIWPEVAGHAGALALHDAAMAVALWAACLEESVSERSGENIRQGYRFFRDDLLWSRQLLVRQICQSTLHSLLAYNNLVLLSITNTLWPFSCDGYFEISILNLRILHCLVATISSSSPEDEICLGFMQGLPSRGRPSHFRCPGLRHVALQAFLPDFYPGRDDWCWQDWMSFDTEEVTEFFASNVIGPQRLMIDVLGQNLHLNSGPFSSRFLFRYLPRVDSMTEWLDSFCTTKNA